MLPALLERYERLWAEGQGGSRPAPMQTAMSPVRAFIADLHDKCRSGCVLFVDGQTAFYSIIRQLLTGRDGQETLEQLNSLQHDVDQGSSPSTPEQAISPKVGGSGGCIRL